MKEISRIITIFVLGVLFTFMAMPTDVVSAVEEMAPTVKISGGEGSGRYLTDQAGMTLYYYTKDSPGMSVCSGSCLERWPIFYAETITVPMGIDVSDFENIKRGDGKVQTTYKGQPLYYFIGDSNPGDIKGQGVYNSWYVVAP